MSNQGFIHAFQASTSNGLPLSNTGAMMAAVNEANDRAFRAESACRAMFDNLTAVQAKCTELLEENRKLRASIRASDGADNYGSSYLYALQDDHKVWSTRNFPNADPVDAVLGVAEEVGELCHAILKQRQGIRGTSEEHEAKAKDAVGDIVIFLLDVCNRRGWSFAEIVAETWAEVRKRDWTKKGGAK